MSVIRAVVKNRIDLSCNNNKSNRQLHIFVAKRPIDHDSNYTLCCCCFSSRNKEAQRTESMSVLLNTDIRRL